MTMRLDQLCVRLRATFGNRITEPVLAFGEVTVEVAVDHYVDVMRQLREHPDFKFELLVDLSGAGSRNDTKRSVIRMSNVRWSRQGGY